MKTMRKVLAWVLAIMMMTGSVCALAETVEYDDLQLLKVVSVEDGGDPSLRVEAKNPDETWEDTDFKTKELTVKAGDISNAEEGGMGPLSVVADGQKVTVTAGEVEQKGDYLPAVNVTTYGEDSEVTVQTGPVTSETKGVNSDNNGGTIDITVESVDAVGTGISTGLRINSEGTEVCAVENERVNEKEISEEEFKKLLEEAGDKAIVISSAQYETTKSTCYVVEGSYFGFQEKYACSYESNEYEPEYFCSYELRHDGGATLVTVEKDVTVEGKADENIYESDSFEATGIDLVNNKTAEEKQIVNVQGSVTATAEGNETKNGAEATAVSAEVKAMNASTEVHIDGNAVAEADKQGSETAHANATAVDAYVEMSGSSATVTVGGNATASAAASGEKDSFACASAVNAASCGEDSKAEVYVAGDAVAEAAADSGYRNQAIAIFAESGVDHNNFGTTDGTSEHGGHTVVTVEGKATASITGEEDADREMAVLARAEGENSITEVTVGKGAEGRVIADIEEGGTVKIDIKDGGIKAEKDAVQINNGKNEDNSEDKTTEGGTAEVTIKGGVTSEGSRAVAAYDVKGTTELSVTGGVSITGKNDATAVLLEVEELGDISALFDEGDITAKGGKPTGDGFTEAAGVELKNKGGTIEATVIGDVSATGADVNRGIVIEAEDLTEYEIDKDLVELDVDLTGSQQYDHDDVLTEEGITEVFIYNGQLYRAAGDGKYQKVNEKKNDTKSTTSLTVIGDVSSDYGAEIKVTDNQTATLVVDGTLSGKEAAVILDGEETVLGENVDLAVWKLESESADGTLILSTERDEETGEITEAPNAAAEKAVRYIVKVMDSWMSTLNFKSILSSGTVTVGSGDDATEYHTALQDEDVKLKISLAEDQELEGIYFDGDNLLSGDNLKQDGEGNFLVKMLRGGGMLLGLKVGHKHTMEKHAAVNETSTTDGNSEYYYCTSCKKYFSDADGKTEIQKDSWVIKAAGGDGAYHPTGKGKLLPYEDVKETDWFYDAVLYCYQKGYLDHISNSETEFGPADEVTRAVGVYILWVMAGKPVSEYDGQFSDVPDGKWYTDAIMWAAENGYMKGHEDGRFGLQDPMPLEEWITALWRIAGCPAGEGDLNGFSDVEKISPWAKEAMSWAVGAGIIEGGDDGSLNAGSNFRKSTLTKIIMDYENL